jgi:endonuclease/exonuclease/phosphatase family metal-dependent hydrolase
MRRIALAMGPVLALVVATVPALPGQASISEHRTASRSVGLDTSSSSLGTSYVSVSWNWSKSDTAYRVQVSTKKDFSTITVSRKQRSSASRPPGGRQATTVGHLHDATYYYVRVRRVGTNKSSWSSAVRVATRAHYPDAITSVRSVPGTDPGSARITWSSDGAYTDFFKITTALTPFGTKNTPAQGRNSMTFRAPGTARSLTLTPEQTLAAGAGLGSGRHLFFRMTAVRSGEADSQSRPYASMMHATVAGEGPTTSGTAMRYAAYNVHVAPADVPGHSWSDRAQLVADNIAANHPAVVALAEMLPQMWTNEDGGPGLDLALQRAGIGRYALTRTTGYAQGVPGDTRILYDPTLVQMTSNCDPTKFSCAIKMPEPDGSYRVAAYAKFQDLASGQEFYVVAVHFDHGNDATTDALRGQQAQAVVDGMAAVNTQNLPVIIGGDYNSSQTSNGHDAPHAAMLQSGYYDTAAAANTVNLQYNSVNNYTAQSPSPYGFGSMYDTIMTLNMPGAQRFEQVMTPSPWPSDHNLVLADLRLP